MRGVYIDAEEPAGQCVVFPVYYIRLFFQKERTKKQKKLMEKLQKLDQNNTILLIEKPVMMNNTAATTTIIKHSHKVNPEEITKDILRTTTMEFIDADNEKVSKNGDHTILCANE